MWPRKSLTLPQKGGTLKIKMVEQLRGWVKVCNNDLLHKKSMMIQTRNTGVPSHKQMVLSKMLLLASLCHSGLPGIFPGFSEGFPTRFACGNDTPSMRLHNISHFSDTTLVISKYCGIFGKRWRFEGSQASGTTRIR